MYLPDRVLHHKLATRGQAVTHSRLTEGLQGALVQVGNGNPSRQLGGHRGGWMSMRRRNQAGTIISADESVKKPTAHFRTLAYRNPMLQG